MAEEESVRSFLACWPRKNVLDRLGVWADLLALKSEGRAVKHANIHLTLAFLGDLTPSQTSAVKQCCAPLPRVFRLDLDRIGYWKGKGIVWAGTRECDDGLIEFVEDLRQRLRRLGFRIETRPFVPHITLVRKARRRPRLPIETMEWVIDDYALVESELTPDGSRYSLSNLWSTFGDVK